MVQQPRRQRVGGAAVKGDEHVAVLLVKLADMGGQVAALVPPDVAHPQCAGESGGGVVDPLLRPAHAFQNTFGLPEEDGPRGGQAHGPGAPVKEGTAQRLLQQTDLLGDGGLGNVELLGGFREAEALRRGHEILQLISIHNALPRHKISFSYFIMKKSPL